MQYSLFIDFDGTIAVQDVGNRFFTTFSGGRSIPIVEKWIRREITSVECLEAEAELITAAEDELVEFSKQFEIDSGFELLHALCAKNDIPIRVVSDGLDIYINAIMKKHGFEHVPVMANRGVFRNGRLKIDFPHLDGSCGHCANCKGAAIRKHARAGGKSIFVGDGYSDLCAIDEADYLFAKADLATYLNQSNKSFLSFETLYDVRDYIENRILKN
ncbi:MAG: MtnX-like HAD-IB family phosphatase [candidate division Zixibacteria bacterium]|nr:MtnX-like HAD-IB family phosphatase [candidate division Zixibacteria bacterium]MBU1469676.1 MtnX-like HAD-IB family phosphatase [candidate division Zixibacteria bacterium]MBU2624745.1 MtnX-like HAD-IB family phosphatase [candidate division Zixibacteria bacterium]